MLDESLALTVISYSPSSINEMPFVASPSIWYVAVNEDVTSPSISSIAVIPSNGYARTFGLTLIFLAPKIVGPVKSLSSILYTSILILALEDKFEELVTWKVIVYIPISWKC